MISAKLILCLVLTSIAVASHASGGYRVDAVYTGEVFANVAGGVDQGWRYIDNLDLKLKVDIARAGGTGSGTLFIYGLYNNGTTLADELVGDLQVTSNIDAPEAWRIFEAWYEYGTGPWSVRAGLYDLNSEFDVNKTGGLFLNSSHGIGADLGQTGENGPSIFPISSLAVRAAWQKGRLTARVAVLDGVPGDPDDPASNAVDLGRDDGALVIGEIDTSLGASSRLWAGYWHYTADFAQPFAPGRADGNDGWYVGAESGFEAGALSGSAFIRYGQANADLNIIRDYIGTGVVVDSPLAGRPGDKLGIAVASAGAGSPYRAFVNGGGSRAAARETTWELNYRARITDYLTIKPNVQFVQNPASLHDIADAWVLGVRFELAAALDEDGSR